ncbi:MAG TPA: isocitrate lyase/phosphoenolpyruvate mutase family protein [Burkholderiaceae bacterium]|nr:isocitrate lyase/phosphoenolpyruvate mutase family protein [Burkholderiaceae bacterium]
MAFFRHIRRAKTPFTASRLVQGFDFWVVNPVNMIYNGIVIGVWALTPATRNAGLRLAPDPSSLFAGVNFLEIFAMTTTTLSARHAAFRKLHETGCFILPNPWDPGTARWLEQTGFKALASTSAGYAFSRGIPDREIPVDEVVRHCGELVRATGLPVNADFEDGYSSTIDGLKVNVRACVQVGVSALSIEDSIAGSEGALYDFDEAVARMRAAREAIDSVDKNVMLVGRAECYLVGRPDLDETIKRLKAYADAGADCLYAPGLSRREEISAVVEAVAPKPINIMMGHAAKLGFKTLAEIGVRRISTASTLALAAWSGFVNATDRLMREEIDGFENTVDYLQLCERFKIYR